MKGTSRNLTFGMQLLHFAQSVDKFTGNDFDQLHPEVRKYLRNNFGIVVLGHLVEGLVRWGRHGFLPGLVDTPWMYGGVNWGYPIKIPGESYYGQASYAYDNGKNLWIVPADKNDVNIRSGGKFKNLIDPTSSAYLPDFIPSTEKFDIKTSIILTIEGTASRNKSDPKPVGVINYESTERLRRTLALEEELKNITIAIDLLFESQKLWDIMKKGTKAEIDRLREVSKQTFLGKERRVFFAYSHDRRGSDVVRSVNHIFDQDYFKEKDIQLESWEALPSGYVMEEIWKKMEKSQAGICYFSETNFREAESVRQCPGFIDNPNVMYEAGMMHALERTRPEVFSGWLILREKDSPDPPFDISNLNRVDIERHSGVMTEADIARIREKIEELVQSTFFKKDKHKVVA